MSGGGARSAEVFFYGFFIDADLLRAEGMNPRNVSLAWVDGYALRIGQRAALARDPGGRVHGTVVTLTLEELKKLYAPPSLQAYRPDAVLATLKEGGVVAALCYNLPQPPQPSERNDEYVAKLRVAARKVGLPAEYVASI